MKNNPIAHAVVWASLMIAVALLIEGHENSNAILMLMVGGWIATGGLSAANRKAECTAFKRLMGKSGEASS